ncbi:MAG: hypothetical protein ACXAD7_19125 [Candidatus Kariarchaeaceae archaeon]
MVLNFDQKAVQQAEEDFKKIDLEPRQRETINAIAKMYKEVIGMSEMAMKGFISFAIRDWQVEAKLKIEDLDHMSNEEKFSHHKRLGEHFYGRLAKIVPENQHPILQKVFHEASEYARQVRT